MPDHPTVTPPPSPPSIDDEAVAEARNPPAPAPTARQRQELQTPFLTGLLNRTVTVYLVNGIRLSGTLKQFDAFTVLLHDANGAETLTFKRAISTLVPGAPAVTTPRRTPFGKLAEWKR